ncbi:MAG: TonB-dependent receptor [Flavobacteriales bacterium]|nr:MAG: TonB-dependent receptor [Flavobacteriales bacterium]
MFKQKFNQILISRFFLLVILLASSWHQVSAQELTQTIRGTVVDKESQISLPGVAIILLNSEPLRGTTTDIDGKFRLEDVAVGRAGIKVSFIGYNPIIINNLIITSGKEVILPLELIEQVTQLNEVVITAKEDKREALNKMALISARSFTVEETQRYAGALNDPSRMAANYAGVALAGDARNDIIIRGNSPAGLLWRLEGFNIPNPNHFGALGSTGGPVSMLNNNLLANSDFMTGAFPAEYGNALSGVFDLKLRNGNNEKHEFTGQIGVNGFELGAEGPLLKKGSFLATYRHSNVAAFRALGIPLGWGSTPNFRDFTFKIDLPTGLKYGRFSLFGLGGTSFIKLLDEDDNFVKPANTGEDIFFGANTGAIGFSHLYFFNESLRSELRISASGWENKLNIDSISENNGVKIRRFANNSSEVKYAFNYKLNKKFNARNNARVGIIGDAINYNLADSILKDSKYRTLRNIDGTSFLLQSYIQWQHKFSNTLVLNTGVNYLHFAMNNSYSIEPRIGLKWQFSERNSINFGSGLHSKHLPLAMYFIETPDYTTGNIAKTNESLRFQKSAHFVMGYDHNFSTNIRLKIESYYQHLYNIPVEQNPSNYSLLNEGADFVLSNTDSLVNKGTGRNYGIDFTLEKFFSKNYYFMITGSLFDSKYKGSDGIERNTAFNQNYMLNVLAGVEINLGKNRKHTLNLNGKWNLSGGNRMKPIDLEASKLAGDTRYSNDIYIKRYKDYSRADVKITYKQNWKKLTHEWSIELQNIFNQKNVFREVYNKKNQEITTQYQLGFQPMFFYRIVF